MNTLLTEIYSLGRFIKKTDTYYLYGYRSLRLRLHYDRHNIIFMVKGVNG